MVNMTVMGMDFQAYLKMCETLGYSCTATAELLPACDAGITSAVNERIAKEVNKKIT